ncbi:MAG TPA: hypothetical protein PK772_01000 [Chitinophagaceae bacterium]|nr:hypothetical protein [Chitinophagaceae bacterium]
MSKKNGTKINWIGKIASEGDPIIVSALNNFKKWGGSDSENDDGESDYDKLIDSASFDEAEALILKKIPAFCWKVEGSGMIQIGIDEDKKEILILKTWTGKKSDDKKIKDIASAANVKEKKKGSINIKDEMLVIASALMSVENFEEYNNKPIDAIRKQAIKDSYLSLKGDFGTGGLVLKVTPGDYVITIKSMEEDDWEARWCRLALTQ